MIATQQPALLVRAPIFFWRQLRWVLICSFIVLAVLPLVVVQTLTIPGIRTQAYAQVVSQLQSTTELRHHQISDWISANRALVAILLTNTMQQRLTNFVTAPSLDLQAQQNINQLLQEAVRSHDPQVQANLKALFLYLPNGRVVAASDASEIGKVVTRQPYFTPSLANDYFQPPYYGIGSDELVVMMTSRLANQNGRAVGVLAAQLDLSVLSRIMLEHSGLGDSGKTYMVSQESIHLLTPLHIAHDATMRAYHSVGIDRGLEGQTGVSTYTNDDDTPVEVVGAYRWIPELRAVMLAEVNSRDAFVSADSAQRLSMILTLVTCVIAAIVGLYIATRISRPIVALTAAASQIADGALDQRVTLATGRNEIGTLALAFNRMATRLQQTLEGLEQQVIERTMALQDALAQREQTLTQLRESLSEGDLLRATVRTQASPVLPVLDDILVMPLIGVIDTERATLLMQSLLEAVEQHHAKVVIIDVTGVPIVDTQVAQTLIQAATAVRLLGAHTVLVGLRPELAQTIVGLGVDLAGLVTRANLQGGVRYAVQYRQRARDWGGRPGAGIKG